MKQDSPVYHFVAVYEDHWEIREGTCDDMDDIVTEFFMSGLLAEMPTTISGVWMLCELDGKIDMAVSNHEVFINPFSAPFGRTVEMNFVLFGHDDNNDNKDKDQCFYYRSLTDEEITQCLILLESVSVPS